MKPNLILEDVLACMRQTNLPGLVNVGKTPGGLQDSAPLGRRIALSRAQIGAFVLMQDLSSVRLKIE